MKIWLGFNSLFGRYISASEDVYDKTTVALLGRFFFNDLTVGGFFHEQIFETQILIELFIQAPAFPLQQTVVASERLLHESSRCRILYFADL